VLTPDQAVDAYIAMWNATDEERRRGLADQALTADAVLLYPTFEAHGRDEAVATGERFQQDTPEVQIVMRSGVEHHHRWVRVAWCIVHADGSSGPDGQSVGELAADGRLCRVVGFRNPLPAASSRPGRAVPGWERG
jgi:hypothetical protein